MPLWNAPQATVAEVETAQATADQDMRRQANASIDTLVRGVLAYYAPTHA